MSEFKKLNIELKNTGRFSARRGEQIAQVKPKLANLLFGERDARGVHGDRDAGDVALLDGTLIERLHGFAHGLFVQGTQRPARNFVRGREMHVHLAESALHALEVTETEQSLERLACRLSGNSEAPSDPFRVFTKSARGRQVKDGEVVPIRDEFEAIQREEGSFAWRAPESRRTNEFALCRFHELLELGIIQAQGFAEVTSAIRRKRLASAQNTGKKPRTQPDLSGKRTERKAGVDPLSPFQFSYQPASVRHDASVAWDAEQYKRV
mgnify:CR=1 FL=1